MTVYYANEQAQRADVPPRLPGNEGVGGRSRWYRATIPLDAPKTSSNTNGSGVTTSDTVVLFTRPPGMRFARGFITSSVSLGTSTISIGVSGAPAKYKAAATFIAVDTPTAFGVATQMAAAATAASEDVILTVGAAALPTTAGAVLIVDMEFMGP